MTLRELPINHGSILGIMVFLSELLDLLQTSLIGHMIRLSSDSRFIQHRTYSAIRLVSFPTRTTQHNETRFFTMYK